MRKIHLLLVMVIFLSPLAFPQASSSNPYGSIEVSQNIQLLDVPNYESVFGAYVEWHISGEISKILRERIKDMAENEMKYSNVSRINVTIASYYFKRKLEPVIEQNKFECGYVGFIKVSHADPEHDDVNGILKNTADVEGLIGEVNSTADIYLRMIVRGEPVEGNVPMVNPHLFFAPFYALASNESDFEGMIDAGKVTTIGESTGVSGGFGNFYIDSGYKARFIIGEYFTSSGGTIGYSGFDPLNSPLILFIVTVALAITVKRSNRSMGENADEQRKRKGLRYTRISRGIIFLSYLFFPMDGLVLLLLVGLLTVLTLLILYFNYKVEEVKEESTEEEGTQENTEDI